MLQTILAIQKIYIYIYVAIIHQKSYEQPDSRVDI